MIKLLKLLVVGLLAGAVLWCAVLPARGDEPKKLPGEFWLIANDYERCYLWIAEEGRFTKGSGSLSCVKALHSRNFIQLLSKEGK